MYDAPHTSQLCASPANLFWDLYNFLIGYIISECTCESPIGYVISEPIGLEPTRNAPMRSEPIESDETKYTKIYIYY